MCFKERFRFEKLTLKIDVLTIIEENCFIIVGARIYILLQMNLNKVCSFMLIFNRTYCILIFNSIIGMDL